MDQSMIEALYSQKNIHIVLHNAIRYELDKLFINWALIAFTKIPAWIEGQYYDSKNKRLQELQAHIDVKGLESLVVAIAAAVLHTHSTQTIQQAVGYLQAFLPHEDPFARAVTAGELLALCSQKKGLFTIKRRGSGKTSIIKVNHWPFVDKRLMQSFDWINDTCFNPPMVEPPRIVTHNMSCGYYSLPEPLLLGKLTQHDYPQNYPAINILNQIEWVLDKDVLAEPEVPAKPFKTREQHENFSAMVTASQFIYKLLLNRTFHFCWQYDSRGRIYSHGYHVNFQSAEYKKASLSFNKYEELT